MAQFLVQIFSTDVNGWDHWTIWTRFGFKNLIYHIGVETVEAKAFLGCLSLRRVIMPGVKVVSGNTFCGCEALTDVECSELEIIGSGAFQYCTSLGSINLPSIKIVKYYAFNYGKALTDVKFGNKLERIEEGAFIDCRSLRRISIPLTDGMFTRDNTFTSCVNLEHVDLVGGIHDTVAALQLNDWRNDMNEEIDSINRILPTTPAGRGDGDVGEKAMVIRSWIRSVLHKIMHYKAQHHRLLMEATTTLELASLQKDIVIENVLPFLELPV